MAKINTAERVSAEASDNFVFQRSLLAYHAASARIAGDVLDLFAGTGQLGIEALSRGAAECVFVDESRDALKIVSENLSRCKLEGRVMQSDGPGYLERGGKFDIIFLDPPYDTTLLDKCLEIVQNVDILTDGGIIVCESRREKVLPELKAPFARIIDRNYGKIKITVYKKES